MKTRQWVIVFGLFALVVLAIVGLALTRDSGSPAAGMRSRRAPLVDERPIQTARSMAALASTREEQRFAQQALRLADHAVDLAFADAMREATTHPVAPTPETKELYARVSRAEAQVKLDQEIVDELKKESSAAHGSGDDVQQQLDLVQAQLELDKDELEDAKGDLLRSGADPLSRIQRQFTRYQATQQQNDSAHAQINVTGTEPSSPAGDFITQFSAWRVQRGKVTQLQQALDETLQAADALQQKHDSVEKQAGGGEAENPSTTSTSTPAGPTPGSADSSQAVITALRRLSDSQKNLADLDKRIQDHQELGNVYTSWIALVQWRLRSAAYGMIQSALFIVLIVLAAYLSGRFIDRFFTDLTPDRRRLRTLRVVVRFVVQAVGVLLILFVLFGMPNQMPTILGLAGAGLTVALKDFIVAFFGWFALMGRNGIRVGDWVEINGVVGEVAEIGLLRTVLLETGNWTDAGHPTGRKVAFVNSFAIEGHFFNFSTSGQWLWDELQILVPSAQNPYPIIDAIQKLVTTATEANARMAEEEWQRATHREGMHTVSAAPAINLRPTTSGVEVHVRYITRAHERYATRTKLYQDIVGLLHQRQGQPASTSSPVGAGT
ncbi:MAG: mechanosensitive ion channel [Acidobacteriia bacterium]|nr:mechanosensitive ion channel [Terriglobia bacterium]